MKMNKKQLKALKELIEYAKPDEKRHFEELYRPKDHIYRRILLLQEFLKKSA